ncbi:MAG: hypothetical protein LBO21_03760 [Synergistaceae bacterium]|jgi:hypothetical protein|nr:hypothetical protein [Synergistaceae bacterium]
MEITTKHFNVSRHVKPTLLQKLAKKIRMWRRVKEVNLARQHLADAVAADRAEIYDPLYAAKRDACASRE